MLMLSRILITFVSLITLIGSNIADWNSTPPRNCGKGRRRSENPRASCPSRRARDTGAAALPACRRVGQLRRSLERELDLAVEARNTERFARNFAGDLDVLVPRVYWEWTSSSMNVQEHIEGIRGDDLEAIDNAGLDRKAIGARGVDAMLKMILIDGFFQADPHPGNVMCLPGNRIALIDFGMVGRLSPARRIQLVNLLAGFVHQDEETMLDVLLDWRGNEAVNEARLAADLGELAVDYSDAQLKDLRIGALLHRVSAILREHSIVLPADLALLFKALITLEGFGRQYDPEFRLVERAEPFLNRAMSERYQPVEALRRGQATFSDFLGLVASIPRDLARLVKDARHGRMRVELDLKRLDAFGDRVHDAVDRATIGIMTASLVVGSSIVMTVAGGPTVFGVSLLTYCGLIGYLMAFVNSLWIILSIWRSGRR